MSESINHTGFVEKIDGDTVFVRITQQSACSGCHAQSMCSASEKKDKIIEVPDRSGRFRINEEVIICGQNSMGLQAVLLGICHSFGDSRRGHRDRYESTMGRDTSGLTGLSLLLPYYCILYLMRDKLKRRFIFTLKKLN